MRVTICKIDESEGVVLPTEVWRRLGLRVGDEVEITVDKGVLRVEPMDKDFARQMAAAYHGMERYKVALQKLADS